MSQLISTWSLKEYRACKGSIFPYAGGCSFGHSFPGRKQMKRHQVRNKEKMSKGSAARKQGLKEGWGVIF